MAASQTNLTDVMALAIRHHAEPRLAEAEACHRQVLANGAAFAAAMQSAHRRMWEPA